MKGAYVSRELRIFEHLSLPYELLLQCGIVLVFEGDCDSSIPCRLADMDLQSKDPAECCHSSRRHHGSVHGAFCCQKFKNKDFLDLMVMYPRVITNWKGVENSRLY